MIASTVDGNSFYPEGGSWKGNNITVRTRSFGGYTLVIDTIPPKIVPLNIYNNADMSKKWSISFKISDNFSGIKKFEGTVDGKWVLMEYDAKNNLLVHQFDSKITPGNHEIKLVVIDDVDNRAVYQTNFKR